MLYVICVSNDNIHRRFSSLAKYYAIKNRTEAEVYMAHPVLGSRLLKISGELLKLKTSDAGAAKQFCQFK
ncbi:MAG: DUF1810 family protein [Eubacteriaceae bacterium]|nr:DUF1810 family protein [Eubacteriaceae bacterium]